MRILQVGKYYYPAKGGIETHTRVLSSGLFASSSVDVMVAGVRRTVFDRIDGIGIERLATPVTLMGAPICPQLIRKLRETDADVVHAHLPHPWAGIAYLASGCKRPLVATYHSDIVRQSLIEPVYRPILLKFLERCSAIICASPNIIEHSHILRRFRERCVVIPFGIEQPAFVEADQVKLQQKKPILLAVGRLVYYKGFEYLIRAMAQVDASLIIIGKGPRKQSLVALARNLGVANKVTILDEVEDVNPYHHAADVFVLPSIARSEAFGIVQLEAMAAGKPVINTQLESGVPFVSPHGVTGLTVPPADAPALAAAINELLGNQEMRSRFGAAAKARAQQEFTAVKMVSRIARLYHCVLHGRPIGEALAEAASAAATT